MCKVIAIANQKGGVGKTTTSINLGIGLVRKGKKVCLVDMDPQGNTTQGLGYNPDTLEITISTILDRIIAKDYKITKDYGVLHHAEGIDLIPANIELAATEIKFLSLYIGREKLLSAYIEMIKPHYDYIIIDCGPALNILTINAFTCAEKILIPLQAQYFSAKGLEQLLNTIKQVIMGGLNSRLEIAGILYTLVNTRTNNYKMTVDIVKQAYGKDIYIYENYIPRSVRLEEAPAAGKSIYEYDNACTAAQKYAAFTEEFLHREEDR